MNGALVVLGVFAVAWAGLWAAWRLRGPALRAVMLVSTAVTVSGLLLTAARLG